MGLGDDHDVPRKGGSFCATRRIRPRGDRCAATCGTILAMKTPMISPSYPGSEIRLDGQVALVTGGGRGLGRAMALALSAAGATVTVCARTKSQLAETVALIQERGGRALAIPADMADRASVEGLVGRVEHEVGPIDLLVNNAGVVGTMGPLAQTDPDAWWRSRQSTCAARCTAHAPCCPA